MRRPTPLKKGDTVGLVAPSSPCHPDRLGESIRVLEMLGFTVVIGESCWLQHGYLAGPDATRAKDINDMFANPAVKGIFCLRGGYGAGRLLDLLDYETIKENPKVFIGYSDITALHIVLNQIGDFVTFHGPMPSSELYAGVDEYTESMYMHHLFTDAPYGNLVNPENNPYYVLNEGEASGRLVGGNLAVLTASIGTKYEIETDGAILFLEDIGEYTYRIDRMLVQLIQAGKFEKVKGILLGDFTDCTEREGRKDLSLLTVFQELLQPLNIPILSNIRAGHCLPTMTLPLGANVYFNTKRGVIQILD